MHIRSGYQIGINGYGIYIRSGYSNVYVYPNIQVFDIIISRRAEGPGREILQRHLSVCPSHLVFAL